MAGFDWDADMRRLRAETGPLTVRDLVIEAVAYEHAALEEMVERMLAAPERCGIAVVVTHKTEFVEVKENLFRSIQERHFRLDPNVPFGHLYEFDSMESYELWQERGCPGPV